ncbi:hypothetical protein ACFL4D_02635 [Candidatus Margulisiibacteriota bacterium]
MINTGLNTWDSINNGGLGNEQVNQQDTDNLGVDLNTITDEEILGEDLLAEETAGNEEVTAAIPEPEVNADAWLELLAELGLAAEGEADVSDGISLINGEALTIAELEDQVVTYEELGSVMTEECFTALFMQNGDAGIQGTNELSSIKNMISKVADTGVLGSANLKEVAAKYFESTKFVEVDTEEFLSDADLTSWMVVNDYTVDDAGLLQLILAQLKEGNDIIREDTDGDTVPEIDLDKLKAALGLAGADIVIPIGDGVEETGEATETHLRYTQEESTDKDGENTGNTGIVE